MIYFRISSYIVQSLMLWLVSTFRPNGLSILALYYGKIYWSQYLPQYKPVIAFLVMWVRPKVKDVLSTRTHVCPHCGFVGG
jgi:hypothetical protein